MRKNNFERQAFRAGLLYELERLGFGGQSQLSKRSGVSRSMVNDILSGRTFGKLKTRESLARALNYPDYFSLMEFGRKVASELESSPNPEDNLVGTYLVPPTLETLLVENRSLRIENKRILEELRKLRKLVYDSDEELSDYKDELPELKGVAAKTC
jgi:transcriptional regulator with XRE-family HTH domain